MRIVRGVSELWDSNTAATKFSSVTGAAAWSPCNRFIATCPWDTISVDILDSVTLQRLQSLGSPWERLACPSALIFSPDSRKLTYSGHGASRTEPHNPFISVDPEILVITWDLQTGSVVSAIKRNKADSDHSGFEELPITYSEDGKKVAVLSRGPADKATIFIFDVISGWYMHDVDCCQLVNSRLYNIWTHGESIQFATAEPTGITIWKVGFDLGAQPTEVKTLPGPDDVEGLIHLEFLPALYRAIFVYSTRVLIWDVWGSKSLLNHADINPDIPIAISSDGRFFACSTTRSGIYLWKESPTGYTPQGKFSLDRRSLFSPDCKSVITLGHSMVRLWYTSSFTTTSSATSIQPQQIKKSLLEFLPDQSLAVVAQLEGKEVTVLDLKSGVVRLSIDTSMEVYGLWVNKDTIVAVGHEKAVTWGLPAGSPLHDVTLNIEDSAQTIHLSGHAEDAQRIDVIAASMSLNSRYIALIRRIGDFGSGDLYLYSASTGQYLDRTVVSWPDKMWFTPDGESIWCDLHGSRAQVFKITDDHLLDRAVVVEDMQDGSWGCPWGLSRGYQVTNGGWIHGLRGERLLMLPPPWQSDAMQRVWSGQFLALLHDTLPEPVIIELEL